ncbi:MAG: D-glycero-beta-D-manno-heptose 1-phosphate adenylyltransferase [Sedimentisphaerales bacterium]|nr:D-glycero-beta-D-manno-heptose 1-phosphate adenylyltransferase [Sedimentisphaerales bacterium]
MYKQLLKKVTNLGTPKVMVVGDFMLDIYTYGDASRISPEAPVPVLRLHDTHHSCGGAGSVAADLSALGATVICVGIIGQDPNGKTLTKLLKELRADTSGLMIIKNRPTTSKQRLIGLAQHRHQQQLFRMDEESTDSLSPEQEKKILNLYNKKLPQVDVICIQDHNKGLLSKRLCRELIKSANHAGKKVIIDPCLTSDYSKYEGATLITPNRQESSNAVGFELQNETDYANAASKLIKKLKLKAIIITLDKSGAYLKAKGINQVIPTRPRDVYDVTGAGDMVLSTIALTLAAGYDYRTAVELANIAGGIEVGKFGNQTVTIDEIIDEIISLNNTDKSKIRSVDVLVDELNWHRKRNKQIVFTNGCFDVLHTGHVKYLQFCKSHGDIVVVGLNSDSSVKKIKGDGRPINNQDDRALVLAALEMVDYITIFEESNPLKLIKKVKPDILIKGQDWENKGVIGSEFVESLGGKVILAPIVKDKSSTATIKKMKSLQAKP